MPKDRRGPWHNPYAPSTMHSGRFRKSHPILMQTARRRLSLLLPIAPCDAFPLVIALVFFFLVFFQHFVLGGLPILSSKFCCAYI